MYRVFLVVSLHSLRLVAQCGNGRDTSKAKAELTRLITKRGLGHLKIEAQYGRFEAILVLNWRIWMEKVWRRLRKIAVTRSDKLFVDSRRP